MSDNKITIAGGDEVGEWLAGESSTKGFLADDGDLLSPPRFKILAPLSRQVKDDQGKDGQIWSDAHGCVIGGVQKKKPLTVESVAFVPICWQRSWIKFDDNMNLEFQTQDPDDPVFQEHGIKEEDKWMYKRLLLLMAAPLNDDNQPMEIGIMTFGSTSYKRGRRLYRDMRMKRLRGKPVPLFAQVWEMGVDVESNAKGEWFTPSCKFVGVVGPGDFPRFHDMSEEYADVVFSAQEDGEAVDGGDGDDFPFGDSA